MTQKNGWKLFTDMFQCNDVPDLLVIFLVLIRIFICCFLNYVLGILKKPRINVFNLWN